MTKVPPAAAAVKNAVRAKVPTIIIWQITKIDPPLIGEGGIEIIAVVVDVHEGHDRVLGHVRGVDLPIIIVVIVVGDVVVAVIIIIILVQQEVGYHRVRINLILVCCK